MDSIDRIAPIAPINPTHHLHVAEANKDGRHKPGGDEPAHPEPHDVLELHSAEAEEELSEPQVIQESPTIGLDLAV
jgi:hypothetical protein